MATTVVNRRHGVPYDVYVGRGSPWGNPYSHLAPARTKKGVIHVPTRAEAIRRYGFWLNSKLATDPHFLDPLKDKVLACWCRPLAGFQGQVLCHSQLLAARCDGIRPEDVA